MTTAFPKPGDLFEERYRLGPVIGRGGFACVYRAQQEDLGRDVALKILMPAGGLGGPDNSYSQKVVARFNQEARLVSQLRDPHTITMYDYGRTKSGLLYMVFEFVDGKTISEVLSEKGRFTDEQVAKILYQTLSSLQEAHVYGVMHRDIKPGNIMVFEHIGRMDQVKLLDFGIAKSLDTTKKKDLTADGALVGTPRYMSPEQIRGEELTPQSDIYSLGLVAYEMLVGAKAIEGSSSVTIIGKQLEPDSFRIPEMAGVSEGMRQIANRMVEKDRSRRYETAAEILADLEAWEKGTFPTNPQTPAISPPDLSAESDDVFVDPNRNRMYALTGIAVLALLLVGLLLFADNDAREDHDDGNASAAILPPTEESETAQASAADVGKTGTTEKARAFLVRTAPDALEISVGGKLLGESPLTVKLEDEDLEFPLEISARLDETHERKVTLDSYRREVTIDFSDVIAAEKAVEAAEKVRPRLQRPGSGQNTRRGAVSSAESREKTRGSRSKKAEKDDDSNELVIPALDL